MAFGRLEARELFAWFGLVLFLWKSFAYVCMRRALLEILNAMMSNFLLPR